MDGWNTIDSFWDCKHGVHAELCNYINMWVMVGSEFGILLYKKHRFNAWFLDINTVFNPMYSIFLIGPYEWYISLHLPLTYEPLMSCIPIQTINM